MGVLAYRVLCGVAPFKGDTPIAIGFSQLHDEPAPLRVHRPEIPPSLEAAVLKALAKKPQDRYGDAKTFGEALSPEGLTRVGRV
jgi:serine/threonine-protein kinase